MMTEKITGKTGNKISQVDDCLLSNTHQLISVKQMLDIPGISFRDYADAVIKAGLQDQVLEQLESAGKSDGIGFGLIARIRLFNLYLENRVRPSGGKPGIQEPGQILEALFTSLPYYQPEPFKDKKDLRPSKVEVSSPFRIDIGMGGLSDLPPWTIERPGRTVSLCADVESVAPIKCIGEVIETPGLFLHAEGRGPEISFSTWKELKDKSLPTVIAQCCILHLFQPDNSSPELADSIQKYLGGGLKIKTISRAPKGLGSSSIIASVILQAVIRLMGYRIDEQDIVHRTISIERMINVSGGWEDCLAAFYGGIVIADSTPDIHPNITARRIDLPEHLFETMKDRLVLFDTHIKGDSGTVLTEGTIRYLNGEPEVIDAGLELIALAGKVPGTVKKGDFRQLGTLLDRQWNVWKILTDRRCTNREIDDLIAGARHWIEGAKVNGAGSGGAVLFIAKEGDCKKSLLKYLSKQTGSVVSWTPSGQGYRVEEWYNPKWVADALIKSIPGHFEQKNSFSRHGRICSCHCGLLSGAPGKQPLSGPINPETFNLLHDLIHSVTMTTSALIGYSNWCQHRHIDSLKRLMDGIASKVYAEEVKAWHRSIIVSTSEGKDEKGNKQPQVPAVENPGKEQNGEFSMALDLIDGTTLAAGDLPGAYCLAVIGEDLTPFPDLQAYAILGPSSIAPHLDIRTVPERSLAKNVGLIATALGKNIKDLTIVCHSDDTGHHHHTIIQSLRSMGVNVIVPNPVIVEAPYTLSACVDYPQTIDAVIGVFGLPETILNTILCAILNREKSVIFTVVGNSMLGEKSATNLNGLFSLTPEEKKTLQRHKLQIGNPLTANDILSGKGAAFAAGVITDDTVLDLKGVYRQNGSVFVNSWLVDPCGNVLLCSAGFERPNFIDYTARYPFPLYDMSLTVQIEETTGGIELIERVEEFHNKIIENTNGIYLQPVYQTTDEPGLHVTLYEFIVQYFPDEQNRYIDFDTALGASKTSISQLAGARQHLVAGKLMRSETGIHLKITIEKSLMNSMEQIDGILTPDQSAFSFVNKDHHITIARFTEVMTEEMLARIDHLIAGFNLCPVKPMRIEKFSLMKCGNTPFKNIIRQHTIQFE